MAIHEDKECSQEGGKEKLTNKRGLFLTNIISKVFEMLQNTESNVKYDTGQNGGT